MPGGDKHRSMRLQNPWKTAAVVFALMLVVFLICAALVVAGIVDLTLLLF